MLLILAGITIVYVFGENGVFDKVLNAKLETELAKIEEKAGLVYSDKLTEKVVNHIKDKPTMHEIVEELKNQGDKIEEIATDGAGITGISLDREAMTLGFGGNNKIKVTLKRSDASTKFYAVVDGKYYEMHFKDGVVTIDRKPSEVSGTGTKSTLNISNSDNTVATATLEEGTNAIIVTATNKAGTTIVTVASGDYKETCTITVKDMPITTAMELNSVRARIAVGYTRWLSAVAEPTNALQEFEWSSSNESVATVDSKGVVTAKKKGTTTITVKTIDGTDFSKACEVTIDNAVDVATLTDFQTENTIARDSNGNLITVPGDFKVLTSEGTKVTDGIVIQDRKENEFVWVPVDSVSTGTKKVADDIRLGRYENFAAKNITGNYVPKQDADNYTQPITINSYFQELPNNSGNIAAKKLEDFVTKTKQNGGYYLARYEASQGDDKKARTQMDKEVWGNITQSNAATAAREMYNNSYIESDLANSYSWDTAIIFIQKYSDEDYAKLTGRNINATKQNTGKAGDEVCNIYDMCANYWEWLTEHCTYSNSRYSFPCVYIASGYKTGGTTAYRSDCTPDDTGEYYTFRPLLYLK